jgi:hypothetical protein
MHAPGSSALLTSSWAVQCVLGISGSGCWLFLPRGCFYSGLFLPQGCFYPGAVSTPGHDCSWKGSIIILSCCCQLQVTLLVDGCNGVMYSREVKGITSVYRRTAPCAGLTILIGATLTVKFSTLWPES